jgi:hypothetical protein
MSPGLQVMSGKAAAAMPFARAACLLEDLAGVRLTVKRVERAAEAGGAALAAASRSWAGLIAGCKLVPMPPDPLPDKLCIVDGTAVSGIFRIVPVSPRSLVVVRCGASWWRRLLLGQVVLLDDRACAGYLRRGERSRWAPPVSARRTPRTAVCTRAASVSSADQARCRYGGVRQICR